MTLHIPTTADFLRKFKALIEAHIALRNSGIDLEDDVFNDAITSFLEQYEEAPQEPTSSVPLPPEWLTTRHPAGFAARHKVNKGTVASTVASTMTSCEQYLNASAVPSIRHEYEIVPLYPVD